MRRDTHKISPLSGRPRRRGTAYLLILGVSVVLSVIGAAAVTLARVKARGVTQDSDWSEAQALAFSAAEHALARIGATPDWRTQFASAPVEVAFGGGRSGGNWPTRRTATWATTRPIRSA